MKQEVFHDRERLASHILNVRKGKKISVVSIDGLDGSGKSRLAIYLSSALGANHIELDKYLEKKQGNYGAFIRYDEVKHAIGDITDPTRITIVEGVCVIQILKNMDIIPTIRIYVKKVNPQHFWSEGDIFDKEKSADDTINAEEKITQTAMRSLGNVDEGPFLSDLTKEIIRYHYKYWPQDNADIIFERVEGA